MKDQELGVNIAKTGTAVAAVGGTALLFTPLLPLGIFLVASSAASGIATTTGDLIANAVRKGQLKYRLE